MSKRRGPAPEPKSPKRLPLSPVLVRRAILTYCAVAVVALLLWGVTTMRASRALGAQRGKAETRFAQADAADNAQRDKVTALTDQQRGARAKLNPAEALRLSAQIQREQALLGGLDSARDLAEQQSLAAKRAQERALGWAVPIIALLALHIIGAALFWPRKGA